MNPIVLGLIILLGLFSFVLLFGAPYLPTKKLQIETALDLLNLKKGQTMLELGCGDGRVLKAAAKRGYKAVGYELNPVLVLIAKIATWQYRDQVKVVWGSFWRNDWPEAEGVFTFLLDRFMPRLDTAMKRHVEKWDRPSRLVSFAFEIPIKKPVKVKNGIFVYDYK